MSDVSVRRLSIYSGIMLPHTRYFLNQSPVRTFATIRRSQPKQRTGSKIPKIGSIVRECSCYDVIKALRLGSGGTGHLKEAKLAVMCNIYI